MRNRSLDAACAGTGPRRTARRGRRARRLPPPQRQPLRAGAGPALPPRHPPLPPAARLPPGSRAARRASPSRATNTCCSAASRKPSTCFWRSSDEHGPSDAISSALAAAYQRLAFQTLADQVRRSVRGVRGNQWMFRMGHPADQPLRLRPELAQRDPADGTYPILRECTPVRMDLTHCGWSDIFFLGMDYPGGREGAQRLDRSRRARPRRRARARRSRPTCA